MKRKELNAADIQKEMTVDVCIVGAAGAGMAAAVTARECGAEKVVLLEKMKSTGGSTKLAVGIFAVESNAQKRLGIHDNADECFKEIIAHLNWNVDAKLVREWMLHCGESIDWLEDKGMYFGLVEPFQAYRDTGRRTYHVAATKGMHTGLEVAKTLTAECGKLGVPILYQTRAIHLITDDEEKKIIGVYAVETDGDGNEKGILINAKSVVLATGSISANRELIARFYGGEDYSDIRIMARIPHNTGDGFLMAEEIGAKQGEIATLFIGPHNHGARASELVGVLQRRPQPIKVNKYGERFIDESVFTDSEFGSMLSFNLDRQPGKICYIILDDAMLKDMMEKNEVLTFLERYAGGYVKTDPQQGKKWLQQIPDEIGTEVEAGRMAVCGTLEEAAEWIGCNADTLTQTFDEYNSYCDNAYDAEFLKPARHLVPLRTPPYYVIKGPSGIDTCIGGILINHNLAVVDKNGDQISGLYAAGVCTSGWLNKGYAYQGGEMSFTLFSGRFAGKHAAEHAMGIPEKKPLCNTKDDAKAVISKEQYVPWGTVSEEHS